LGLERPALAIGSVSFPFQEFPAMTCKCTGLIVFGLSLALAAGCSRESPKGGPGAENKTATTTTSTKSPDATSQTTTTTTRTDDQRDDFTVKVPNGYTNVTQGEQQSITVKINRNGKFDQEVTLKFDPPVGSGLHVEPATATVAKDKKETQVTVRADAGAKTGTTDIRVTGMPQTGKATDVNLGVEVKAASK
jgi:uncharacterized membrane protein